MVIIFKPYQSFWLVLCLMAAVVMVLFFLLFWEKTNRNSPATAPAEADDSPS